MYLDAFLFVLPDTRPQENDTVHLNDHIRPPVVYLDNFSAGLAKLKAKAFDKRFLRKLD